jgi:hypothetical protein
MNRWEYSFGNELGAVSNTIRKVDAEHGDGCASDVGATDQ